MPILPLFGTNQSGKSSTSSAERHLNIYAEIKPEGEKSRLEFHGTPGLVLRAGSDLGDTPIRGWIAIGSLYYLVHRGTFYEVDNPGTKTSRGTISTTSGRVDMAYDGTLILITTGTNMYTYTISSTTFAVVADADAPQTANTCAWLDGQFLVDDGSSDQFQISPDGLAWDALDFATAESAPDGLVRVFADNGEGVLFGEATTEYLGNTGAADFPFQTIRGATQEFGLAARWSLTKFNSGLAGLMKNKQGQVQVMFIQGYVPKPISTQEIDYLINNYASVSDATAYSYMLGGHPMFQINFPTPLKSWLYDASTGMWSPLEYGLNAERHRGEIQLDFLNKTLIADYSNGNIYQLSATTYTDNGVSIAREIIGRHFFDANERIIVDEFYADFETGVGTTETETITNLLTYSEELDHADWTKSGTSVTPDNATAPDGSVTADTITGYAAGGETCVQHTVLSSVSATFVFSVYLKGSGTITLTLASSGGDYLDSQITLTSDFVRYSVTYTFDSVVGTASTHIISRGADTATSVYAWGAQLEYGSTVGTYVKTEASSVSQTFIIPGLPQAMLSISKDNAHTWGNELWKSMGAIGKYLSRVVWRRLGLGRDHVYKIRVTDPVKFVLTYAAIKTR